DQDQHQPAGGWKFERAAYGLWDQVKALAQTSTLPQKWRNHMATTTEPRVATVSVTVGDQELTFESGKIAKQADGAVVVRSGETMVLAAATGRMEAREG